MQLGWAASRFLDVATTTQGKAKGRGDGCGDDLHSWGYCGNRGLLWHDASVSMLHQHQHQQLKKGSVAKWAKGDVVGCSLSLHDVEGSESGETRSISVHYTLNGRPIGPLTPSFSQSLVELAPGEGIFPALSMEADERVEVNLGTRAFLHRPISSDAVFLPVKDGYGQQEKKEEEEGADKAAPAPAPAPAPVPVPEDFRISLEDNCYSDAQALEGGFSPQELAHELRRRGLKAGGSHSERAQRLFLVRGLKEGEIDVKLKAKPKRKL